MSKNSPTPTKLEDLSPEEQARMEKLVRDMHRLSLGNIPPANLTPQQRNQLALLYNQAMTVLRAQGRTLTPNFLQIRRVTWIDTEVIPTACITARDRRPTIYVNINFINDLHKIAEDKKLNVKKYTPKLLLAGILSHELCHFMFRHGSKITERRLKEPKLANFVQDIFINHFLWNLDLHHFSEIYYPSTVDERMMFMLNPTADPGEHKAFFEKCRNVEATLEEIEEYLLKHMPPSQAPEASELLGSHEDLDGDENGEGSPDEGQDGDGKEKEGNLDGASKAELEDTIRETFLKGSKNKRFNKSASKFGELFDEELHVEKKKDKDFEDFSKRALFQDVRGQLLASVGKITSPNTYPVFRPQPTGNKHQMIKLAAGIYPTTWKKRKKIAFGSVCFFIDVSGSMTGLKDLIFSIIAGLERNWEVVLYTFCTEVHPISKKELELGQIQTTGGTDFNAIFNFLRKQRENNEKPIKKIVMITDGYDSGLKKENTDFLEASNFDLYVVYTKNHSVDCLEKYTKDKWLLDF